MSRAWCFLFAAVMLWAVAVGGAQQRTPGRFVAVTQDALPAMPGLQVVTIRDSVQDACYVLFVMEGEHPASSGDQGEPPPTLAAATALRDAKLQQLGVEFERTQYPIAAGIPPNPLKFVWEGQKIQNDFERAFLEREFARLGAWVAQLGTGPRLAVSGPGPCSAPPPSKSREQ